MSEQIRAINAAIAENYDALVYDPVPEPMLDVDRIFGLAAMFGDVRTPVDVLDLGCGTGVQLMQAASQVHGSLVGTDISSEACRLAKERLRPFGDRVRIECADLFELTPELLGEFDLIYNVGVIYVTPPEVQRRILALIGHCLRPGGVVLMSYYSGGIPSLRAYLHRMLRAETDGMSRQEAYFAARERLELWSQSIAGAQGLELLQAAIAQSLRLPDLTFFHEVLNNAFEPLSTLWLERELSRFGVSFAGHLLQVSTDLTQSSKQRAMASDSVDLAHGRYRYGVFAKIDGASAQIFGERPVTWTSNLFRENRGGLIGDQAFEAPDSNIATVHRPAAAAMFDILLDGPASWPELVDRVGQMLAKAGIDSSSGGMQAMERDLCQMWRHGFVFPKFSP